MESPAEAFSRVNEERHDGDAARPLTRESLRRENLAFAGTGGVSQRDRQQRLLPAFRDEGSGRVELSRYADGKPAPMHIMDGLPDEWIDTRNEAGEPASLKAGIVAGFVRDERFYTREQAAALTG